MMEVLNSWEKVTGLLPGDSSLSAIVLLAAVGLLTASVRAIAKPAGNIIRDIAHSILSTALLLILLLLALVFGFSRIEKAENLVRRLMRVDGDERDPSTTCEESTTRGAKTGLFQETDAYSLLQVFVTFFNKLKKGGHRGQGAREDDPQD